MAGTRLTVHLLFAVQLGLLVCVACYVGLGRMGGERKVRRRPRRRAGIDLLPTHLLDGSWVRREQDQQRLPPFHHSSLDDSSLLPLWARRRHHVLVTLVDEDPTSYHDTAITHPQHSSHYHHHHHAHLSQALTETLDQTLGPMLHQRLSPILGNGNFLSVQTVLHQGSLSSMAMTPQSQSPSHNDANHGKNNETRRYFLELDDNNFGERFWNHHNHLLDTPGLPRRNSNTIHFVVYVPPKNRLPMFVRRRQHDDDESRKNGTPTVGTSFTLPSFFVGAVSIVNLPDNIVTNHDDDSSTNDVLQHYRLAVEQAVSHFGTALRQYMGLHSTTTNDPTQYGCSDVELKELCRSSWNIQYPIAFANIQTQLDRILRPYNLLSEWTQEHNIPILSSSFQLLQEQHWLGKHVFRWLLTTCSLWADAGSGPFLSMDAAQGLLDAVSYLEQSHRHAKEGQFEHAMEDLQRCHQLIQAVTNFKDTATDRMASNFSWEQYMAIFSPLLLPLVLPMVIGLIRERKRYKQLTLAAAANEIKLQS